MQGSKSQHKIVKLCVFLFRKCLRICWKLNFIQSEKKGSKKTVFEIRVQVIFLFPTYVVLWKDVELHFTGRKNIFLKFFKRCCSLHPGTGYPFMCNRYRADLRHVDHASQTAVRKICTYYNSLNIDNLMLETDYLFHLDSMGIVVHILVK
jgi:hypothetical protein